VKRASRLVGHDAGECRFAAAGRTVEERVGECPFFEKDSESRFARDDVLLPHHLFESGGAIFESEIHGEFFYITCT
jgi:hypothetical protein